MTTKAKEINKFSNLLKIISEPNRLLILESIIQGVQCNCELGSALQMAPNLVSHHLSVLREAGLIDTRRDPGDHRWVYYSINIETIKSIKDYFNNYFDPDRVKPRLATCGPGFNETQVNDLNIAKS